MSRSRQLFRLPLFRGRTARSEMAEELAFHLEERVARLVANGMAPDDARAEAIRRLGGSLADAERRLGDSAELKERRLDVRTRLIDFIDDMKYAFRGLLRSPGFTAVAVATLAIGIGANTAIYSAVDALLLRSLPFYEPRRLMTISQTTGEFGPSVWSWPKYAVFRDGQQSFSSLALYAARPTTITGNDPERVVMEEVTAPYLRTLGLRVAQGQDFDPSFATSPGSPRVAILSDALWQRRFNADPSVIGKTVDLNNEPWQIVGVLPPGFRGLTGQADLLANLTARPAELLNQPWSLEFSMIGRLKDGRTPEQADAEAHALGPRIYDAYPSPRDMLTTSKAPPQWSATAQRLNELRVAPGLRRSLLVLFGAVGLVLLIACANLANLLMARALARRQEIAVRLAIGAGRGRLIRMLVTESLVLAGIGGAASLAVALAATRVLSAINPQDTLRVQGLAGAIGAVGFESIHLDARALAFTFGVTVVVGLLFGLAPALRATRADLLGDLKDGSAGAGSGRRIGVSRRSLVVAEIALALVLLAGCGLMIKSLGNLLGVDPGFDGRNVLTLRLSVPAGVVAPDSMPGFYDQVQAELAALPGVQSVALADCPPLSNGCNGTIMTFADRPSTSNGNAMVGVHWVSPAWFTTMHVPLKRGRLFDNSDRLGTPKVVVINETAARRYFPGEDPIGKRVAVYQGGFNTGADVVGIVGDVRFGLIDSTAQPDVYISYGQARIPRMMIFVRTAGDPSAMASSVRAVLRRSAPRDPIYDIKPMADRVAAASAHTRFSAVLLGLFAAVALTLAAMGIYGVMSFGVAQRTREIGIRVALGANRNQVLGLVMREGMMLAGAGVVIGLAAALAFTRALKSMLFEVTTTDPPVYLIMVAVIGVVVSVASWVPARRAARVNPIMGTK